MMEEETAVRPDPDRYHHLLDQDHDGNSTSLDQIKKDIGFPSCRFIMTLMSFLGFVNVYALRVNLSVALVAMVNSSYVKSATNVSQECPGDNVTNGNDDMQTGEFPWSPELQGLILGSFFYGYIVTQLPGGWLAQRMGAKWLFGGGVLCTSVLTLLTPVAARLNVYVLIAVRVLEGLGEGVTFPAMHALLSGWAPPLERSKMGAFIYSGSQMGTVISMPISGLLCKYGFAGGWPSVFYVFGSLGCLWFVLWCFLCYDNPAKHPRISSEEYLYIERALATSKSRAEVRRSTPWRSIFSSLPVWAIIVAHTTNNWGYYTLLTCLPTYMAEVLNLNISQNGFLSGIPYLFSWMTMALSGQVSDTLRKKELMSTTNVRKTMNTIGQIIPAIFLVITGYIGCDTVLAITMVTTAVGFSGTSMSGYGVNHLDIAPSFAGILFGLSNAAATIPGFLGPQVVGKLTNNNPSRGQWQIVFFISAAVNVFGTIVFLAFGKGEQQSWAAQKQTGGEATEEEGEFISPGEGESLVNNVQ